MIPYDRLTDEERRRLVRDLSEAAKRIQDDAPAAPPAGKVPRPVERAARPDGLRSVADSLLARPPWRLRLKIDSYACSRGYAVCGLPQYFASLVSFLNPSRDFVRPRFARDLVQDRASPGGPAGYGLEQVLAELERQSSFLLAGGQVLKRATDGRAPLRQAILHDLKTWEPFGFSFLHAFQRFDGDVYRALAAIRARTDLQRGVDAFELSAVVRAVFRAVLLCPAGFDDVRRRIENVSRLIQSGYKREFSGSGQIEGICRRIEAEAAGFLGCYARLRWFAHQLYPVLLKLLHLFEEESNLGRILPAVLSFVDLDEKRLLRPVAAAEEEGGWQGDGGVADAWTEAAVPPDAPPPPAVSLAEEYRGILTVLGYAFPGSRIEEIGEGEWSSLFWFHQKIWAKERIRPGTPGRRAELPELLGKISRRDPLAPLILLHGILGELLDAVNPEELGRLTRPGTLDAQSFRARFEELHRRWPVQRAQLFERYLQEVGFYGQELAAAQGESLVQRRTVETINQIRSHVIRGYGWTVMGWDRLAVFKCEPLYETTAALYGLLGQLALDREQISRDNPVYAARLEKARVARLEGGPVLRQLAGYIAAIPPEKRLLKDPGADAQRAFLEILLGLTDLLDFLVNDPRSPLREAGGRVFVPDEEDRSIRTRIRQDTTPLRVELRRDFEEVDRLTGLLNKNHYLQAAPRLFEAARAAGESLSLLILDLDHFKAVNDSHGHAFGDEVLKTAAQVVLASMREEDLAVRFGGEELLVLVRGDHRAAFAQGERIRVRLGEALRRGFARELAAIPRIMADKELEEARRERSAPPDPEAVFRRWGATPVGTASIGVAQGLGPGLPSPAGGEADLLARADRMLYLAKDSGRNRVVGMVDALRRPLLYEEFTDSLSYAQEQPGRPPEGFVDHREGTGRPLRFASYPWREYLQGR